jgi:hypothetical protein
MIGVGRAKTESRMQRLATRVSRADVNFMLILRVGLETFLLMGIRKKSYVLYSFMFYPFKEMPSNLKLMCLTNCRANFIVSGLIKPTKSIKKWFHSQDHKDYSAE